MAKKRGKDMTCPPGTCGAKCIGMGVLAAVFGALGLWLLVTGVLAQVARMPWTGVFWWYLGGFVLWMIAKMCKYKACPMCARY